MKTTLRRLLTLLLALAMAFSLLGVNALAAAEASGASQPTAAADTDTDNGDESENEDENDEDEVDEDEDDEDEDEEDEDEDEDDEDEDEDEDEDIDDDYDDEDEDGTAKVKKSNKIKVNTSVFLTCNQKKAFPFQIKASAKGGAKLSYTSNNKRIKVSAKGKVTVPKGYKGKFVITVKSGATSTYKSAQKRVTVMVGPAAAKLTSVKASPKLITVNWNVCKSAKVFRVQVSNKKNFSKVVKTVNVKNKNSKITAATVTGLKKGTYFVRIRSLDGNTFSAWSKVVKVNVKK